MRHFLGRDLRPGDVVKLRPLRDLVMRDNGTGTLEWISEFSLEVKPRKRKLFKDIPVVKGLTG